MTIERFFEIGNAVIEAMFIFCLAACALFFFAYSIYLAMGGS